MEQKYAAIRLKQLALANKLYGDSSRYDYYLEYYTLWNKVSPSTVQKHSTIDSVFFISQDASDQFKIIKFYNSSKDYRVSENASSWSEAHYIGESMI